jgi:Tol biopolymer transport system component/DNA-binding winged helix-turn-helix (wHTH) protein
MTRFGLFEVDRESGELRKRGTRVKLQDQPFRILTLLLDRRGEVVTREELRSTLWPDGTYVDFEHSLNAAVAKLRQALGDSSESPRFIETIARRGYRFIAPVEAPPPSSPERAQEATPAPQTDVEPAHQLSRRRVRFSPSFAAAVAAVFAAAMAMLWLERKQEPEPVPVPLTSYPGLELRPAFSPDGDRVAFTWNGPQEDNTDIYVQVVGSGEPLRLTSNPAVDDVPAWSPDGRWIAFVRRDPDSPRGEILMVPSLGGAERKIGETFFTDLEIGPTLAWTPDSEWVAAHDDRRSQPGLYLFSIETGEKKLLVDSRPTAFYDYGAAFSADGAKLAFCRDGSVYVLELDGVTPKGQPTRLTGNPSELALSPSWSPDQRDVIFQRSLGFGSSTLWRMRPNGSSDRIQNTGDFSYYPAVAPRRLRLAYVDLQYDSNIYLLPLRAAGKSGGPAVRVIASSQAEYSPVLSPDGSRIAFGSNRSGTEEIWVANRDGTNPEQLTRYGDGLVGGPCWSPNGEAIAYTAMLKGNRDIFVTPVRGGPVRRLTDDPADDWMPSWSADGKWVYYSSDKGGTRQIWKRPAKGGADVQVTSSGGFAAHESPDGKYFCYLSGLRGQLWVVPIIAGVPQERQRRLAAADANMLLFDVSASGVYFGTAVSFGLLNDRNYPDANRLFFYDFATGRATVVAQAQAQLSIGLSVSHDERSLLFSQVDRVGADLMLRESFR